MEGKKSFVLYTDLLELVEELTDEEAGLLFKTILRYVNDLNPEIPKEIKLAFIPIKQDLKRDLKKYNEQVERINRINAERKRKKDEQTRNDIVTTSHEVEGVNDNVNVNVNVNDNVNEISNDIINKENTKEKVSTETAHAYGEYKRIRLKDSQYNKLVEEFGKEKTDLAITKLDEYVQSNNNKNKYKDFYLVLRKVIRENWFNLNDSEEFTSQSKREIQFEEAIPGQSKRMGKKQYTYANTDVPWEEL